MKMLFDVHCAGTYLGSKAEIDKQHSVVCVGQPGGPAQDAKDENISEYASEHGCTIVTKDVGMVKLCLEKKVPVVVLKGADIFTIAGVTRIVGREPPREIFSQN
jgi:rRNA-processing protein FCF1